MAAPAIMALFFRRKSISGMLRPLRTGRLSSIVRGCKKTDSQATKRRSNRVFIIFSQAEAAVYRRGHLDRLGNGALVHIHPRSRTFAQHRRTARLRLSRGVAGGSR